MRKEIDPEDAIGVGDIQVPGQVGDLRRRQNLEKLYFGADPDLNAKVNKLKNHMKEQTRQRVTFADDDHRDLSKQMQSMDILDNRVGFSKQNEFKDPLRNILKLNEDGKPLSDLMQKQNLAEIVNQNQNIQKFLGIDNKNQIHDETLIF